MAELMVREFHEGDEVARREIIEEATRELRSTYRPRKKQVMCNETPRGVLVAFTESELVGTAEYIRKEDHIYVQGVAVHPAHRARGVCRALLRCAQEIVKAENLPALALCAIEETGNVEIFKNLGFKVIRRAIAPNHVSPSGGPVILVDMERKFA